MKIHKCEKCGYETKYTTNLKNHLNRKNPCDKVKINVNISPNLEKLLQISPNLSNPIICDLQCKFCFRKFTRKGNLERHVNFRCKEKKKEDCIQQKDFLDLKNKLEKVEEELKNIKEKPSTINNNTNSHNRTKNINNYYCVPFDNRSIKHVLEYCDVEKTKEKMFDLHILEN